MGYNGDESGKNQFLHLTYQNDQWVLREENNKKIILSNPTKEEALKKSIQYAKSKRTELEIHKRDGKIQDRRSYGNDPKRSRG